MNPVIKNVLRNGSNVFIFLLSFLLFSTAQNSFAKTPENNPAAESSQPPAQSTPAARSATPSYHQQIPYGFSNWDPYAEIQAMREQMDRIFNEFDNRLQMSPFFRQDRQPFAIEPDTDIEEADDKYIITMNIPGADNGNIKVKLEENVLNVSAVTMQKYEETKDRNYIRMERSSGSIQRVIPLPAPVDNESMTSTYKDGILTITVKKKA